MRPHRPQEGKIAYKLRSVKALAGPWPGAVWPLKVALIDCEPYGYLVFGTTFTILRPTLKITSDSALGPLPTWISRDVSVTRSPFT